MEESEFLSAWNGCRKALTFSYDDGIESDRKLVEILNRHHMKATFNLNSGLFGAPGWGDCKGFKIRRLPAEPMAQLYAGHEIAVHGYCHQDLSKLSPEERESELTRDIDGLTQQFRVRPLGMAFAYGGYDDDVLARLENHDLRFARTVRSTHSFALPAQLPLLDPTCHHDDPALFSLAEQFLASKAETPQLFYVWGHAYEYDGNQNWDRLEKLCTMLEGRSDIFYGTNRAVLAPLIGG